MSKTRENHVNLLMKMVEENNRLPREKIDALSKDELSEIESASDSLLASLARQARESAFAPYSEYPVGAALLTDKGVYLGGNIEISGRSTSVHAEMLAAYKAVFDGATEFEVMAVSTPDESDEVGPCGLCQHTLSQFTEELRILEDTGEGNEPGEFWLSELIGEGYSASTRHLDEVRDKNETH